MGSKGSPTSTTPTHVPRHTWSPHHVSGHTLHSPRDPLRHDHVNPTPSLPSRAHGSPLSFPDLPRCESWQVPTTGILPSRDIKGPTVTGTLTQTGWDWLSRFPTLTPPTPLTPVDRTRRRRTGESSSQGVYLRSGTKRRDRPSYVSTLSRSLDSDPLGRQTSLLHSTLVFGEYRSESKETHWATSAHPASVLPRRDPRVRGRIVDDQGQPYPTHHLEEIKEVRPPPLVRPRHHPLPQLPLERHHGRVG